MTAALLALMSYSLIGEAAHEWIGVGMALLFILHLALNRKWLQSLGRGRYTVYRVVQTALAALCLLTMLGLMASGIILSRHMFALRIRGWSALARQVHMACSFWGFVLMSLHLGLPWGMLLNAARRFAVTQAKGFRALGCLAAAYGVYAFWKRGFSSYYFRTERSEVICAMLCGCRRSAVASKAAQIKCIIFELLVWK